MPLQYIEVVVVVDVFPVGVGVDVNILNELPLPESPALQEQTPLEEHLPCPEQFLGQSSS
jgi:hypothetical protein